MADVARRSSLALALAAVLVLAIAASKLLGPVVAQGRTHTVTTLADDGPGSLRQAIADAADGDTITFAVTGTIALASTLEVVPGVDIQGPEDPAAGVPLVALDGGGDVAVMEIWGGTGEVVLTDLAIVRGRAPWRGRGAAITHTRPLRIESCYFADHDGAVIHSGGSLVIERSRVSGGHAAYRGGGIDQRSGTLTVVDSAIVDNVADGIGGGLAVSDARIVRSLISGNRAQHGAAVYVDGTASIANTTIADNVTLRNPEDESLEIPGGSVHSRGLVAITNSTIASNASLHGMSSGLVVSDTDYGPPPSPAVLVNTIVSANEGGNCLGPVVDGGGNLQHPDDACGATIPVADPRLVSTVQGPWAPSPILVPGANSPAVGAADPVACAVAPVLGVDQRRRARDVSDSALCDVGAIESASEATPTPGYTPAAEATRVPPDLVPDRVTAHGPSTGARCVGPDTRFGLFVSVHNRGLTDAGPFDVLASGDPARVDEGLGSRGRLTVFVGGADRGPHWLSVDPGLEVDELDESNNMVDSGLAIVGTLPPPCTPTPTGTATVGTHRLFVPASRR